MSARWKLALVILFVFGTWPLYAQFNVASYGAVADCSTDNATAFQNAINAAAANQNGGTVFIPAASTSTGCYVIKTPLKVQGHRLTIKGQGLHNPALLFDFSAYVGTLPKYGFIVGETSTSAISATANYDSARIEDLRMAMKGSGSSGGGILVQRNPFFYVRAISIATNDTTAPGYGIRVIASDSQVMIDQVLIGSGDCATSSQATSIAPAVGISIEDGSNQTFVHSSTIVASATAIQVANSVGVWIERNEILSCASPDATLYGVKIVTGQAIPSYLTWLPAYITADVHVTENIFEPLEFSAETIYDVYVGSGAPSSPSDHGATGVSIRDNLHLGTSASTRKLYTFDYADQAFLNNAHWIGTVTTIATITANASKTTVDLPDMTTYNTAGTPTIISDAGYQSVIVGRYMSPAFASGDYSTLTSPATWTVDSSDVATNEYTVHHKRMHMIVWLGSTTVSGGNPYALYVKIPGGFVAAKAALTLARVVDNGNVTVGFATVGTGSSAIQVSRSDGAPFAVSANNTYAQFEFDFEVQ
ncbi:MAG TPA: glycosyl hydrolase family 28-related protein [Thermoanaerobaculia bacterium]|jgi:hypothetical protein